MIVNARLLRIDAPGPPTTGGAATWANGPAVRAACFVKDQSAADSYPAPGELAEQRKTTLRILSGAWQTVSDGVSLLPEMRLQIQADGDASVLYRVRSVGQRPKGSLSFLEAILVRD